MRQDDLVVVDHNGTKRIRYLARIDPEGKAEVYAHGATSISVPRDEAGEPITFHYAKWEPYRCGVGTDGN